MSSNYTKNKKYKYIGDYELRDKIGEGTFSKVYGGIHVPTGSTVAVKVIDKANLTFADDKERVRREIHIMKRTRHPFVIQMYEIIESPSNLYLVIEYASKGELFDHIVTNERLKEREACKFYQQLVCTLEYLHSLKICHRDLKPENLLLDKNFNLKLVDFGLSNTYYNDELLQTPCGSPCYAAPEMLQNKKYQGAEVDVWSSGVVLYAMLCGFLPFEHDDNKKLQNLICNAKCELPAHLSYEAKQMLTAIFTVNPSERVTLKQIKSFDFYTMYPNDYLTSYKGLDCTNMIPKLSPSVLSMMTSNGFEYTKTIEQLVNNKHNLITTYYYLSCLNKDISIYDSLMSRDDFNSLNKTYDISEIDFQRGTIKDASRPAQSGNKENYNLDIQADTQPAGNTNSNSPHYLEDFTNVSFNDERQVECINLISDNHSFDQYSRNPRKSVDGFQRSYNDGLPTDRTDSSQVHNSASNNTSSYKLDGYRTSEDLSNRYANNGYDDKTEKSRNAPLTPRDTYGTSNTKKQTKKAPETPKTSSLKIKFNSEKSNTSSRISSMKQSMIANVDSRKETNSNKQRKETVKEKESNSFILNNINQIKNFVTKTKTKEPSSTTTNLNATANINIMTTENYKLDKFNSLITKIKSSNKEANNVKKMSSTTYGSSFIKEKESMNKSQNISNKDVKEKEKTTPRGNKYSTNISTSKNVKPALKSNFFPATSTTPKNYNTATPKSILKDKYSEKEKKISDHEKFEIEKNEKHQSKTPRTQTNNLQMYNSNNSKGTLDSYLNKSSDISETNANKSEIVKRLKANLNSKGFVTFPLKEKSKLNDSKTYSSKLYESIIKDAQEVTTPRSSKSKSSTQNNEKVTVAVNRLKRNQEFNTKRTTNGLLEDNEKDRLVSRSPDIRIKSTRQHRVIEDKMPTSTVNNSSIVSERFKELSPINEEKNFNKKAERKSESKTPNISSKIKSSFILKYKNTEMQKKIDNTIDKHDFGIKTMTNFSSSKVGLKDETYRYPTANHQSKTDNSYKYAKSASKSQIQKDNLLLKSISEQEFRIIDSKQVNLSFLLNKEPSVIVSDIVKVCGMRKYQVKVLGCNQLDITVGNKKANIEICKVGKMKYYYVDVKGLLEVKKELEKIILSIK